MSNIHINIGSEKSCFFVPMSLYLINRLKKYPMIYYAVEEAMECQKNGYYSAAILVFSQILNILNEKTPDIRHDVAHKILEGIPTKQSYEQTRKVLLEAMAKIQENEGSKYSVDGYQDKINQEWSDFIRTLQDIKTQK